MGEQSGVLHFQPVPPAAIIRGNAKAAARWRDHLHAVYPEEADHLEQWFAQRIQHPGVKLNHALVLGGMQGIGKDSLLEPIKLAIGAVELERNFTAANAWAVQRLGEGGDRAALGSPRLGRS